MYICTKDIEYKYLYNGNCFKECPSGTQILNYTCKVDPNECSFGEDDDLYLYNNDINYIEVLAKSYISEFSYTNKHISLYKNDNYSIMIYKDVSCIKELALEMPSIIFESCYNKVIEAYNIDQDLIVAVADKKILNNPITFFSFYHPVSGEKLEVESICNDDDKIIVEENLYELLNKNYYKYNAQTSLTNQGINIFDKNHPFFNDLCYDYENILKKDIPLSRRIKDIFPNATLCDDGCVYESIDLENMVSKCDCKFNDIANNNLIQDNEILSNSLGEIFDLINSSNIMVLKCIKYMFKHFERSIGGWISLIAIIAFIAMVLLYFLFDLKKIKIFIMKFTENYLEYISKTKSADDSININTDKKFDVKSDIIFTKEKIKNIPPKRPRGISNKKQDQQDKEECNSAKQPTVRKIDTRNDGKKIVPLDSMKVLYKKPVRESTEMKELNSKYFKEFFEESVDDMEYDDAIVYDKRKFGEMFLESLREKQITANTFISKDELKPRSIKIMVFILNIILYLVINGLFFGESVIEELYDLDESKEHFFSYFPRLIDRMIYCTLVGIVIGYIEDFFFVELKKFKGIYLREKDDIIILKEKISDLINEIKKRNFAFVITESILLVFSFIYLCCFNYVYPYTQVEWIKSSITIVIIMQILSILKCLLLSGLRALSFKIKNVKFYKLSKVFE